MDDPAGWYPDPYEPDAQLRWWDGESWSPQVVMVERPGISGWIGRHTIIAGIIAIVVITVLIGVLSGEGAQSDDSGSPGVAVAEESEAIAASEGEAAGEADERRPSRATEPAAAGRRYRVVDVIDGDTLELGNGKTVRLVGIDTPERGECGYQAATARLRALVDGKRVALRAAAEDRDRYGRLLRYVDRDRTDAGLQLIESGLAVARYDSRDGYGRHPREQRYIAADRSSPSHHCR